MTTLEKIRAETEQKIRAEIEQLIINTEILGGLINWKDVMQIIDKYAEQERAELLDLVDARQAKGELNDKT